MKDTRAARRDRRHAEDEVASDAYRIRGYTDVALVFDVGAYHGSFSRYAQQLYPNAIIHAFEPNPASYTRLTETTQGVRCHNVALGAAAGEADFLCGKIPSCSALDGHKPPQRGAADTVRVTVQTLPFYIDLYCGMRDVDILKLDCEGAEADILEARHPLGTEWLHRLRYITGEWHGEAIIDRVILALKFTHLLDVVKCPKRGTRGGYFYAHRK